MHPNRKKYAWNCIDELSDRRLISEEEKEELCKKIGINVKKPPFWMFSAEVILPFLIIICVVFLLKEPLSIKTILIYTMLLLCAVGWIFINIAGKFNEYERWKTDGKNIKKKEVYKVPVIPSSFWQEENRNKTCRMKFSDKQGAEYYESYPVSEESYINSDKMDFFAYYYEGKKDKYHGRYRIL